MQETNQKTPQRSLLVIVLAVLMCVTAVAWFALVNRSRSVDMEIEMPPVIYIRDDNLQEMTSFDLDGLEINKTYNAVFCVAPAYKGAVKYYDLGVIHTENIGMIIDLYPVKSITDKADANMAYEKRTLDGKDCYFNYTTSDESWKATVSYTKERKPNATYQQEHLNRGVYKTYSDEFKEYAATESDIYAKLNDTEAYRFYVLQVTWKENISEAELEKETDVVYIVTQGGTKRESESA